VEFEVAVLDVALPDGNGADLIGALRAANPGVAVLVLSASLDSRNLQRATQAGADEILDKLASPTEVVGTIRRLVAIFVSIEPPDLPTGSERYVGCSYTCWTPPKHHVLRMGSTFMKTAMGVGERKQRCTFEPG